MKLGTGVILFAVPLALLAGTLYSKAQAQDQATKPADAEAALARAADGLLFVGVENNEPFSYLDKQGMPAGFDVDVMKLLAEKSGKKFTIKLMPRAAAIATARSGKAEGIIGLGVPTDDEQVRAEWRWCGPTVAVDYYICTRQDNAVIDDLDSLNGGRVAVLEADSGMIQWLFAKNPNVTTVTVNDVYKGCLWVDAHRVSALVADRNAIQYFARKADQFKLRFAGVPVFREKDYGPAIPVSGSEAVAQELAKAVKQANDDGSLERLRKKWFDYDLSPTPLLQQPWMKGSLVAAAALLVISMVVLTWRWQLGAAVERRTRKLVGELEVLRKHVAGLQLQTGENGNGARKENAPQVKNGDPLGLAPLDLNGLVRDAAETMKQTAGEFITVAFNYGEGLPMVDADADRVHTALMNLITNARDAILQRRQQDPNHPGRISVTTRMAKIEEFPPAKKDSSQPFVALSVRDTGCGLAPAEVQKIFEAGYTTKPNAAGHGLTFVYGTIAQHGGWIDVESAPGRGANFSLFLPAAEV